jgi:hypothetical protein
MMFEITGDDIAHLNDEDLRTLVGLLCEAELRRRALPLATVTWGGNQTAKDGGLDVHVELPADTKVESFIPKPHTGFQVKKPDMPRGAIIDEMKPKGALRPIIVELIRTSGAYVIVSASGSTSSSALASRRQAMAEALDGIPGAGRLTLDFYDRNRIATWLRDHIGLIPWVRSRIGKPISGWRSYGSWSRTPAGSNASYLADDTARIRSGTKNDGDGLSAIEGINRIRDVLRKPGTVTRLVGLSGVGKTRLAEALFDPSIGAGNLDSSLAIYTDVADSPSPQPAGFLSDLIVEKRRAVVIVDNCPPDVHRQLSEIVRADGTTVSLLTIEYDIREDQPEGTDVFSLDTSSPELIEGIVSRRYPRLSQVDTHTIAEFSGGNARIAVALAGTIGNSETIAGLTDEDLFQRLFQQRHGSDPALMSLAEACSLVYSFDGEKLTGQMQSCRFLPVLSGRTGLICLLLPLN